MTLPRPVALACAMLLATIATTPAPAAVTPADTLVGLWKAQRWFGPHARGDLIVARSGEAWTADMIGRRHAVRRERGELAFELPSGQGRFRGRLEPDGTILGTWYPPPSSAQFTGGTFASPVLLRPNGPQRWRGVVAPFEDVFTFYLLVQQKPDGSLRAVLRNPDRDLGTWLGVERLERRGDAVRLIGRRIGPAQDSVAARGAYDAGRDVLALTFPTRGGTYDFQRDDDQSGFYPRGRRPGRYAYHQPPARDDGWPTGTLEEARISRAGIEAFVQAILDTPMDSSRTRQVHGILIARHGKLVLEEYFHGEHRDKLHDTRSATKSLTTVVVGAAIQAGTRLSPSTPVYRLMNGGEFPADLEPRKRAMTLEHLLTMSAGYFCDDGNPEAPGNEERMLNQTEEPDFYRYTLRVPMASAPGEKAVYCSSNPNLALGMVGRATGESPMVTFDRLVGVPMKIHRYGWLLDPAGQPYGGGSVNFLPRDFMKLGQLMLNGGTWQGRRILAREFVARASAPLYHLANITYGYLWWGTDYPYKDRTVHAYFAGGAGGQGVTVIPELDLVIATYGGSYSGGRVGLHIQQELIPRYILPAVREPGDAMDAPVVTREYRTPYGRSAKTGPVEARAAGSR